MKRVIGFWVIFLIVFSCSEKERLRPSETERENRPEIDKQDIFDKSVDYINYQLVDLSVNDYSKKEDQNDSAEIAAGKMSSFDYNLINKKFVNLKEIEIVLEDHRITETISLMFSIRNLKQNFDPSWDIKQMQKYLTEDIYKFSSIENFSKKHPNSFNYRKQIINNNITAYLENISEKDLSTPTTNQEKPEKSDNTDGGNGSSGPRENYWLGVILVVILVVIFLLFRFNYFGVIDKTKFNLIRTSNKASRGEKNIGEAAKNEEKLNPKDIAGERKITNSKNNLRSLEEKNIRLSQENESLKQENESLKQENEKLRNNPNFITAVEGTDFRINKTATSIKPTQNEETAQAFTNNETFFLASPNEDGSFDDVPSKTFHENKSLYKFTVNRENGIGTFEIAGSPDLINMAANRPDRYLDPACENLNAYPDFPRVIVTKKPGTVYWEENKWKVKEKAQIVIK